MIFSMKKLVRFLERSFGFPALNRYSSVQHFRRDSSAYGYLQNENCLCRFQRLQTCQEYIDQEGRSHQSLAIKAPKYHKHYILPGKLPNLVMSLPFPYTTIQCFSNNHCWHFLYSLFRRWNHSWIWKTCHTEVSRIRRTEGITAVSDW